LYLEEVMYLKSIDKKVL